LNLYLFIGNFSGICGKANINAPGVFRINFKKLKKKKTSFFPVESNILKQHDKSMMLEREIKRQEACLIQSKWKRRGLVTLPSAIK